MPVHVVGIPPSVLQALPEEPRLADAADFVPPRDDAFLAVLPDQLVQGVHQLGLRVLEPLVVRAEVSRSRFAVSLVVAALFRGRAFAIRAAGRIVR